MTPPPPEAQASRLAAQDRALAGSLVIWRRLGLFGIGLLMVLIVLAIDWVVSLGSSWTPLAVIGGAALVAMLVGLGLWAAKEIRALSRLGTAERLHALLDPTVPHGGVPFDRLLETAGYLRQLPDYAPALDHWRRQAQPDHPAAAQLQLFETLVLKERDAAAVEHVRRAVRDAFVTIALSPTALTDTALFAWRAMRLVRQVADVYGLKPGFFARLRLARQVLLDLGTISAADLVGDAVSQMLGDRILEKVSTAAGEGAIGAWRMARLGLMILERCRPLPFDPARRPGLSDVRPMMGLR